MAKRESTLSTLSTADMQREIARRERGVKGLVARRTRLIAKLENLDKAIIAAGGTLTGGIAGVRKRAKNEMNLVEALAKVLKNKTMGVTEVSEAVQKAGYQTTAANFRTIVNQCLINNNKVFKKVERGHYTAA
jgi:hypothetical protein